MNKLLKNRSALSTVVTTLIILVVSVLLAGVVTYFAINVTSTRVQEESLNIVYDHVWFSTFNASAESAMLITNTGGRDVVLDKIAVRGQPVSWNDVFWFTPPTNLTASGDFLVYCNQTLGTTSTDLTNVTMNPLITTKWTDAQFTRAVNPIVLKSASTLVVYMVSDTASAPGSVTVSDVGLSIAISVFTSQATYYKETNVNAVSTAEGQ